MALYNNGNPEYDLQKCKDSAKENNWSFFGLQNSTTGTNAQCFLSNSLSETSKYGPAGNCTQISDGTWSGGGWSNAVYNAKAPESNYFLILQDDGNMCVYRGTGPSDNQGYIWGSSTNGKQKEKNPLYTADKSKYGKNWISSGSTLAIGDFVGSTNGDIALIMQSDGNLVLYTFTLNTNCQKMSDGNIGSGPGGNAIYDIGKVSIPGNIGKLAYIDQNSELLSYPSSNAQYYDSYTKMIATNSGGYDIPSAAYGDATVEKCQNTCNNNPECGGFAFSNNVCYPKTSGMFPIGSRQIDENVDLYIRNKNPIDTPLGVPETTFNIDTITYQNYINGGDIANKYGLATITSEQQEQLSKLEEQMTTLSSQINTLTQKFSSGSQSLEEQSEANMVGISNYLTGIKTTNKHIKNFNNNNFNNILKDSDIVVLQKNYEYLFWSILAAGTVLITMNIIKK